MILIEDVRILRFDPPSVSSPEDVLVDGSVIRDVGQGLREKYPAARRIDGGGRFLSAGLVCSHGHLYSALARGILAPIPPSKDFVGQLRNLWWRLDRAIDEDILRSSALAGGAEAVLNGVTAIIDHHASPSFIDGSLSVMREALESVGVRSVLCFETTDRNGMDGAQAGVRENRRFAEEIDALRVNGAVPLTEALIGAHASFTIGQETLAGLAGAAKATGRGLHIHAAEDKYDPIDSRYRFDADITARLDAAGLLGPRTIIAHGLYLTPDEIDLINERDAFLVQNPRSNMNNGVGYAPWLERAKNRALGTDGIDLDMLTELKAAFFRHRESGGHLWPQDFLAMLNGGNRLLERSFGVPFGNVKPGDIADLVIWDYAPPTPMTAENLGGHFVYGVTARNVRTVMVDGHLVVDDGKPAFDLGTIADDAREQAARLWKRMEKL